MSSIQSGIREEWRYWLRSKVAGTVLIIGLVLLSCSVLLTAFESLNATHEREHLQEVSEQAFLDQPARHPHRMVHYGHYVFRTPSILSMIDPGLDAYTGNSIFLEGHRQNSAMFAERQTGSGVSTFGSLSPAMLLQMLAPMMLILMGYNTITRERDNRTYDQLIALGISPLKMMLIKGLALASAAGVILLPLLLAVLVAIARGEPLTTAVLFFFGYVLYLAVWCAVIFLVSFFASSRNASLGGLLSFWVLIVLLVPPVASSLAAQWIKAPGKIESDFAMLEAAKAKGDGHNAADPAFTALKANLLAQYDVDTIEELPLNFRGVVAQYAEAELTDLLNEFAEERMQTELQQAKVAREFAWLSPLLAIREFSMVIASVDLETHHRFLREAEAVRFDFVQSLNKLHETQLAYSDDINRSSNPEAERRTRVSAINWAVLNDFNFKSAPAEQRLQTSMSALMKLLIWGCIVLGLCFLVGRRSA